MPQKKNDDYAGDEYVLDPKSTMTKATLRTPPYQKLEDIKQAARDAASNKAEKENAKYAKPSSYKRGGKVKKTGLAKVHKGELVLTKKEQTGHVYDFRKQTGVRAPVRISKTS